MHEREMLRESQIEERYSERGEGQEKERERHRGKAKGVEEVKERRAGRGWRRKRGTVFSLV